MYSGCTQMGPDMFVNKSLCNSIVRKIELFSAKKQIMAEKKANFRPI